MNLESATAGEDLDFFVVYSSATTMVGSPGQGAYGGSALLWFAVSMTPFMIVSYTSRFMMIGMMMNRPLLAFPTISVFDILLSRVLIEICVATALVMSLVLIFTCLDVDFMPFDVSMAMSALCASLLLGSGSVTITESSVARDAAREFSTLQRPPSITSGDAASTPENVDVTHAVYIATATDPDGNTVLTYSLGGGVDDDKFNIDSKTGAVTFRVSPNFEAPTDSGADNVYDIVVQASDGANATTQAVAITVTDVKEAPTGQIVGFAYVDQNGNNARDAEDVGLAKLYVRLYDTTNGHLIDRVAPDADGHYMFTGVGDGTYRLSFDGLGGYLADQGTVDSTGSLVVENVVVQHGGLSTVNEGFYQPVHLGGHVSVEGKGIDGVEVDLLDANHNLVASTHSSKGLYNFDNLKPGVYLESVVTPHGYVTHQPHQITLESGQNVTDGDVDLHRPVHDFNGDGLSDILFQNETANGAIYIWAMDGTDIAGDGSGMPGIAGADWAVKGVGDFNGDGKSDIVFQNTASGGDGAVYIWAMDGTRIAGDGTGYVAPAGSDWVVKGVGDFNGDGNSDIVFQNTASADGAVYIWSIDGTTILNNDSGLPGVAGKDWVIKGVGDFNGDGKSDIVFQNTASADGAVYIWEMNGAAIGNPGAGYVANAGKDWEIKGVGDFNGDHKSDLVFQNTASGDGAVYIWSMDGTTIAGDGSGLPGVAGKDWIVKGVGDFNGDGKSDILFQNANADGAIYVWGMNGASIKYSGTGFVANAGADWHGSA